MTIHLTKCEYCLNQFRIKTVKKIKVSYIKGNSVILHCFECSGCKHIHVTKWDTHTVNEWADKVFMLECNIWMDRKDSEKCEKYLMELEIAKSELIKVTS
jgi:hypothetical protein